MKRLLCFVLAIGATLTALGQAPAPAPQYTADGRLIFPKDYRQWVFLSSGLGMTYGPAGNTDGAGNPRFDNVFVNPAAYKSFLETGTWPDKTVFILEVRRSDSKVSINSGGRVQGALVAVEAGVKDVARFPGGWAFFDFSDTFQAKAIPATANCYSCHREHGAVDNTFVQFYPTLYEVAKKKGTLKSKE
jgi:hypothetical protein